MLTVMVSLLATLLVATPAIAQDRGPYEFTAPVFDIDAAPDGSIVVAAGTNVMLIKDSAVLPIGDVPVPATTPSSALNGVAAIGDRNFWLTSGGGDLADGAALWRATPGGARLVGDIDAFETQHDPDAQAGTQWKDPRCEHDPVQGFSAGPQSNPYHVSALSGGEALVADAAGNSLLAGRADGRIELAAVFTPPVDESGDYRVLFTLGDGTDCYVQPVPTAVAIGPDGASYVGELTGAPAVPGWSRIWRIEPGARNVTCPSAACAEVISGLTSVIDLTFGPDGRLYVVEYDANGWLAVFLGNPVGGTVKRCDVASGWCTTVVSGLTLPGAITFDKWGDAWLLENNIVAPTVYRLALP
jgi:hypothetical protein